MHKENLRKEILMVCMFVLIGCIITAFLGITLFYGNRMTATYASMADAAAEIKLEATSAHLWFEEILGGDRHESMDDVWRHIDAADWYATAMLEGGRNTEADYHPLTDTHMRQEIRQVKRKLKHFREVTEQRFNNREHSIAGSDIDQVYDKVFKGFLTQADAVETQLKRLIKQELRFFNLLIWMLIVLVIISVVMASMLFYTYHRKQNNHTAELQTANQRMYQVLDNLEEKVAERTHDLSRANEKLQELDRLKSIFISSMSHELRTPLNSIIDLTGRMLQNHAGELTHQPRDYLQRIEISGKHLVSLISDVIDVSRIEAGKVEAAPSSFKLHELLTETIDEIHIELARKGLALHTAFPNNIEMHTDRLRLHQCILNLLSNAIKFSERGEIRLSTRVDGPNIEIAVEDDGIGIDRLDMQRLFQPFEHLFQSNRKSINGAGLGLYLTKKLTTELLKGNISAESQAGVGSRFTLRIPLQLEIQG